ncbi:MAG: nucleotidyltransferase domain-containing protein [Bacteroidales bacterium]
MRITEPIRQFFVEEIGKIDPRAEVYLFGSRTDDLARGGDIDILILSEERIPSNSIRILRREFFKSFGWQKLDLVNFLFNEEDPFKNLILNQLVRL